MDLQKEKRMTEDAKKTLSSPCNHILENAIAPPPQRKTMQNFFYLQNGYLYFCLNQTILEIKGVGIWPAMGCGRFASLYPKSFYCII